MQKWYYCPNCGNKLAKFEPLDAFCKGVYIKCRHCKEISEIKCAPKYPEPRGAENKDR